MNTSAGSSAHDYESSDASPRVIGVTALTMVLGVCIAAIISAAMYVAHFRQVVLPRPLGIVASFRHGPDERTSIEESWMEQDAAVSRHLGGYSWADKQTGVVRIPVDRAMDLLVQEQRRGL